MLNLIIRILSYFTKPIEGNSAEWLERNWYNTDWREFHCGSCRGIYKPEGSQFTILAVQNTKKNGDFNRVLEWFDNSCKIHNMDLVFLEVGNKKLRKKLIGLDFFGNKKEMRKIYKRS